MFPFCNCDKSVTLSHFFSGSHIPYFIECIIYNSCSARAYSALMTVPIYGSDDRAWNSVVNANIIRIVLSHVMYNSASSIAYFYFGQYTYCLAVLIHSIIQKFIEPSLHVCLKKTKDMYRFSWGGQSNQHTETLHAQLIMIVKKLLKTFWLRILWGRTCNEFQNCGSRKEKALVPNLVVIIGTKSKFKSISEQNTMIRYFRWSDGSTTYIFHGFYAIG